MIVLQVANIKSILKVLCQKKKYEFESIWLFMIISKTGIHYISFSISTRSLAVLVTGSLPHYHKIKDLARPLWAPKHGPIIVIDRPQGSCGVCDIPEVLRSGAD